MVWKSALDEVCRDEIFGSSQCASSSEKCGPLKSERGSCIHVPGSVRAAWSSDSFCGCLEI